MSVSCQNPCHLSNFLRPALDLFEYIQYLSGQLQRLADLSTHGACAMTPPDPYGGMLARTA